MIVRTYVVDGYGAPFRNYATHDFVIDCVNSVVKNENVYYKFKFYRSSFGSPFRKLRKSIIEEQYHGDILLLVGKSYGAKILIKKIINHKKLPVLNYREIHLFTIDPNWPKFTDLTPNLNNHVLSINSDNIINCINVYVKSRNKHKQCGCLVYNISNKVLNHGLNDEYCNVNHNNIIYNETVKELFRLKLNEINENYRYEI